MLRNKKPAAVPRGLKSFVRVGDPEKKYKISKGIGRRTTRGVFSSVTAIFTALLFSTSSPRALLRRSVAPEIS
jgi:hypothetical protein